MTSSTAGAGRVLETTAAGLLAVAVATSTWNAVALGPLKPAPIALAGAVVLLVLRTLSDRRRPGAPAWLWALPAAIVLVVVLTALWPPDPAYLAGRYVGKATVATVATGAAGDLTTAARWLVGALALPVAVCAAARRRPRLVPRLADAWALGTSISALVCLTDEAGVTRISPSLLTAIGAAVDRGGRQAGLTVQANHAALGIVLALAPALWRATSGAGGVRARIAASIASVVLLAGLVVTGSRTGLLGAVFVVVGVAVVDPRLRRWLPVAVAALAVAGALVAVWVPAPLSTAGRLLDALRGVGSGPSDRIRAGLAGQALRDVAASPVHGIGLGVAEQAHDLSLQLLAAGGVLLLAGFAVTHLGLLRAAWSVRRDAGRLSGALAVSAVAYLVMGVFANQLTDVFVHVPLALVAGLCAARDPMDQRRREGDRVAADLDR